MAHSRRFSRACVVCLVRERRRAALFLSCTRRPRAKLVPRRENLCFSIKDTPPKYTTNTTPILEPRQLPVFQSYSRQHRNTSPLWWAVYIQNYGKFGVSVMRFRLDRHSVKLLPLFSPTDYDLSKWRRRQDVGRWSWVRLSRPPWNRFLKKSEFPHVC